ncbi:hypothetical protein BJ165DRAFT_1476175 [Panaeolus papilionaceus]|nr:hypothetical protein BJ165DRAFT_1476175 [Panaeolus papilionaceus]
MDVLHNVSLFLAFNANPTSKDVILITDLAFILDQITARLSHSLTRSRPSSRLLRSAKLYASRFHFADWIPLQRRAPLFSRSFRSVVHILSLYAAEGTDYKFSYLTRRYTAQWKKLCEEVLQSALPSIDVVAPNAQPRNTPGAHDHNFDIDIAESLYPSIEPEVSNILWMPPASSTTNISLQTDIHEEPVGMPTHPAPVLITNSDRRHLTLPRRSPGVLLKHSFDSDNSCFYHNAGLPRRFISRSQDNVVGHLHQCGSLDCTCAKAYEMV